MARIAAAQIGSRMIYCEQVTKSYPMGSGRKQVLKGVDLQIRPGEQIGFLGRNGAGKTTLSS